MVQDAGYVAYLVKSGGNQGLNYVAYAPSRVGVKYEQRSSAW